MKLPAEPITKLAALWLVVDAMWRIELKGDTNLAQQWRQARNLTGELREMWDDRLRLEEYVARHEKTPSSPTLAHPLRKLVKGMVKAGQAKPGTPETLCSNGKKTRPAA